MAGGSIARLAEALRDYQAIRGAINVLTWDQLTKMPPGGAAARADQLATLERLAHAALIDPALEALLQRAEDAASALDPDSDEAALVRIARRDRDQATKLPADLVAELARTATLAEHAWEDAREHNDFTAFAPWLRKNVDLNRRMAEHLGYAEQPFDALVNLAEPGMTTAGVRTIFAALYPPLRDLAAAIAARADHVDDSVLHRTFPEEEQERLAHSVSAQIGYDFRCGRLDRTIHPFEISMSRDDVRITTRYDQHFLPMALMGTIHETGHALYEQGIGATIAETPLGHGVSAGVHESQSRLWENVVGRSRPFWQYLYPQVQAAFPGVLDDVDLDRFYAAVNAVHPTLIRVEADEVTYCLHIMVRFELETALLEGTLAVEDTPAAWNAAMQHYLGIIPSNDTEGVLQDIHWSSGLGGFQGYALGNVIAAQLWETVLAAHPELPEQIARGEFGTLLAWLRTNVHQHGRKYDPSVLVQRATGRPLQIDPYIRYLRAKYTALYGL